MRRGPAWVRVPQLGPGRFLAVDEQRRQDFVSLDRPMTPAPRSHSPGTIRRQNCGIRCLQNAAVFFPRLAVTPGSRRCPPQRGRRLASILPTNRRPRRPAAGGRCRRAKRVPEIMRNPRFVFIVFWPVFARFDGVLACFWCMSHATPDSLLWRSDSTRSQKLISRL